MISLKMNKKGELQKATGKRSKDYTIYKPNQADDFQISRGKFDNFLLCPRCFYLDRVGGLSEPSSPGWALNSLTDTLLKIEFDQCRKAKKTHRILIKNNLSHIIPFDHPEIDAWRDSLHHGIKTRFKNTNIILQGGVDDLWLDTTTEEVVVLDYKSQAKSGEITMEDYLDDKYHQGYKKQLDFYNFILRNNGFKTSKTSYFLVVNALNVESGFNARLEFSEHLIPYENDTSWLDEKIEAMIACLNQKNVPEPNESCENCAYAIERSKYDQNLT